MDYNQILGEIMLRNSSLLPLVPPVAPIFNGSLIAQSQAALFGFDRGLVQFSGLEVIVAGKKVINDKGVVVAPRGTAAARMASQLTAKDPFGDNGLNKKCKKFKKKLYDVVVNHLETTSKKPGFSHLKKALQIPESQIAIKRVISHILVQIIVAPGCQLIEAYQGLEGKPSESDRQKFMWEFNQTVGGQSARGILGTNPIIRAILGSSDCGTDCQYYNLSLTSNQTLTPIDWCNKTYCPDPTDVDCFLASYTTCIECLDNGGYQKNCLPPSPAPGGSNNAEWWIYLAAIGGPALLMLVFLILYSRRRNQPPTPQNNLGLEDRVQIVEEKLAGQEQKVATVVGVVQGIQQRDDDAKSLVGDRKHNGQIQYGAVEQEQEQEQDEAKERQVPRVVEPVHQDQAAEEEADEEEADEDGEERLEVGGLGLS